jgi:hypothetical protein
MAAIEAEVERSVHSMLGGAVPSSREELGHQPSRTETTASPSKSITMAVGVRHIPSRRPVEALECPIAAPAVAPHPQWHLRNAEQEN